MGLGPVDAPGVVRLVRPLRTDCLRERMRGFWPSMWIKMRALRSGVYSMRIATVKIGERFGRLLIIEQVASDPRRGRRYRCLCDCGAEKILISSTLTQKSEPTRSCGCLGRERRLAARTTHGNASTRHRTPTYSSWAKMLGRVRATSGTYFQYYGSRGITVCERWLKFENFLADMGPRPPGRTLDRYPDNDGNYEPGNCRWATKSQQRCNQRTRAGKTLPMGVGFDRRTGRYTANINVNGKRVWLGRFPTPERALEAYRSRAEEVEVP